MEERDDRGLERADLNNSANLGQIEREVERALRGSPDVLYRFRDGPPPSLLAKDVAEQSPQPDEVSHAWLGAGRMTRTETSLRLGVQLIVEGLVDSDVSIALTGAEITKQQRPRFPVEDFLASCGAHRLDDDRWNWRGNYMIAGATHALVLHDDVKVPRLVAKRRQGGRLIVEVAGGPAGKNTRSPTEHKTLRGVIGRAVTLDDVEPGELVAIAVPRSPQMRKLSVQFRAAPVFFKTGLAILLVDRLGGVDGLQGLVGQ